MMGYLSCKMGSSVVTCESHKKEKQHPSLKVFRFKDLEAATGGFAMETLLGKGSHGCVYKGVLADGMLVAVKRPSIGRRILQDEAAFDNEIRILSKLNNPRLVRLVGFSHDSKEKLLVVEFMHNGTLYDILHHAPEPLSWSKRVHLALQTARAVLDLHNFSPPIIHRDIKSSNILIDRHWNAKLGDFGLALCGQQAGALMPPAGTLGYLDPEYTTPEMLSTKNDVFSFGILLLEILSGRNAIDVHYNPPSILDWAIPLIKTGQAMAICDPKLQPPKSTSALKQLATLAARCVRSKTSRRPDMGDVVQQLHGICRRFCYPMLNGIALKMKRNMIGGQKKHALLKEPKAPTVVHPKMSMTGHPKSPRVCDGSHNPSGGRLRDLKFDVESTIQQAEGFNSLDGHGYSTAILQAPQNQVKDLEVERACLVDLFRDSAQYLIDAVSKHAHDQSENLCLAVSPEDGQCGSVLKNPSKDNKDCKLSTANITVWGNDNPCL